jgi:hypothetical protein
MEKNVFYTDYTLEKFGDGLFRKIEKLVMIDLNCVRKETRALDIILLSIDEIEKVSSLYRNNMVIICYSGDLEQEQVQLAKSNFGPNLLGYLNSEDDISLYRGFFENILEKNVDFDGGETISKEVLRTLYEQSLNELERIKKIHKKMVPIREEKLKNLYICSKFSAGLSSGGEFFDMIKKDEEILIVLSSFKSYLGTSIILKNLENLRDTAQITDVLLEDFLEEIANDCRDVDIINSENHELFELDLFHLNLNKMSLTSYHFGKSQGLLNDKFLFCGNDLIVNENNFEISKMKSNFKHGDRFFYFSPGATSELNETSTDIKEVIKKCSDVTITETLNECMYHLKKNSINDFLKNDSSLIFFEVSKNAIIEM